ncbi:MAG: acyl-CoA dehydrogenase, partial [Bdellovibrionales bacterium]|nr:acyl-CoA dehydrogenase [Bdellovibrionales bacterium]
NCTVSQDALLGNLGDGYKIALSGLTGGRVNIGACAVGISRSAMSKTVQHLLSRKQFGKPLADLQGLQFRIADMKIHLDSSALLVARAATALSNSPSDSNTRLFAAIAKCKATDAAMAIATDAVQLHGALGYVRSTGVERLMRDAKMLQIVEGANEVQRATIARYLFEKAQT